jgi:TIR domain
LFATDAAGSLSNGKESLVADRAALDHLAQMVLEGLAAGEPVEIQHLGTFYEEAERGFRFEPCPAQVFVAYVTEDAAAAGLLYDALTAGGFEPWMDVRNLAPGQNWPRAIERAIDCADFFVPCFSSLSVNKWGGFQAEIRYALDCARHVPLDDIFIVPVRLDECRVPRSIQREYQYIDLFPDWARGIGRLLRMMRRERRVRLAKRLT